MCKGFQPNERDCLKIKGFYLHLSFSSVTALPDSLTLHYLPRISESPLEINDSKIRSSSPGFVTLHRVLTTKGVIYGSRDRVKVSEGVKFEILMAHLKVIKGIFMNLDNRWRIDCKCALENDDLHVKGAEVCVTAADQLITEKVEMSVRKRRRSCFQKLEEIPEQREVENDELEFDESTCCCSECEGEEEYSNTAAEGVGWAVDVGIWVMCLGVGVGYLVSRAASSKSLRRRRFI